ncbi:MAG TPA: hypothetical protein DEP87_02490 [Candidatus Pacebacteria bacterium]|nr:hypothetical protein [Candidatus Paceibacterota bacterium]
MTQAQSPASNSNFYDAYHQHQNRGHANWRGVIKPISVQNFTYFFHLRALKPFLTQPKNLRVLDVGCGVGTLSLFLAAQGVKQVVGLDLSARAISQAEVARQALNLTNLKFHCQQLSSNLGQFDLILASEIIEHVPQPAEFVKKLAINLKPGGHLILTTPYAHNWLRHHGYLEKPDQVAGHLAIYDEISLQKLFPVETWKIVSLTQTEGPLRMLLFILPLGILIKFIRGPLVSWFHILDEILAKVWGHHDLILVGRKVV